MKIYNLFLVLNHGTVNLCCLTSRWMMQFIDARRYRQGTMGIMSRDDLGAGHGFEEGLGGEGEGAGRDGVYYVNWTAC